MLKMLRVCAREPSCAEHTHDLMSILSGLHYDCIIRRITTSVIIRTSTAISLNTPVQSLSDDPPPAPGVLRHSLPPRECNGAASLHSSLQGFRQQPARAPALLRRSCPAMQRRCHGLTMPPEGELLGCRMPLPTQIHRFRQQDLKELLGIVTTFKSSVEDSRGEPLQRGSSTRIADTVRLLTWSPGQRPSSG